MGQIPLDTHPEVPLAWSFFADKVSQRLTGNPNTHFIHADQLARHSHRQTRWHNYYLLAECLFEVNHQDDIQVVGLKSEMY